MTPQGVSRALRARNVNVQSGEHATIQCRKGGPTGVMVWVDESRLLISQVERSLSAVETALDAAGYGHYRSESGTIIYVEPRTDKVSRARSEAVDNITQAAAEFEASKKKQ